jgi:hypothetical protein
MVAEYMARGGTIKRMPEAEPHTIADVLNYLKGKYVEIVSACRGEATPSYLLRGKPISPQRLIGLANRYRRRNHQPPFDVVIAHLN